jgi:hypothetical protein
MEEEKEVKPGLYKIRDGVYLKEKSFLGEPSIIYPIKDPETKKINWKNLIIGGSWTTFIFLCLIIIILTLASIV